MSLIIHTITKYGIIACSDTRTTIKDDKGNITRFDDTAEKTVPFPNKIVVSHCDSQKINTDISVTEFLYHIRHTIGDTANITSLPLKILNAYHSCNGTNPVIFLISGIIPNKSSMVTYEVNTDTNTVKLLLDTAGSAYEGTKTLCDKMFKSGIDFNNLSLEEGISLTKTCLEANIEFYKYIDKSCIGGTCQTYVIDNKKQQCGWLNKNGTLRQDKNISDTAECDWLYSKVQQLLLHEKEHKEHI